MKKCRLPWEPWGLFSLALPSSRGDNLRHQREPTGWREAVRPDTKAHLKILGWTAVITIVAVGVFLAAVVAGLPQGPTVGFIVLALVPAAVVLHRVYGPVLSRRDQGGKSAAPSPPDAT
jgi:hypothetical protein